MAHDFFLLIWWWLIIFLIGLIFLPLSILVFPKFFDKGYLFSKSIGLALSSYLVWLLSSLHMAPFSRWLIIVVLILFALLFWLLLKPWTISRAKIKIFLLEEALFILAMIFFAYLRALLANLDNLEKFMDLGFVNATLRAKFMPPSDIWFAKSTVNYYYYGHYLTAFLVKLSGLDSSVSFNLMISTLFAFAFGLAFSIGSNLVYLLGEGKKVKIISAGLISAFLLTLGGNLHTFVYAYLLPFLKQLGLYHQKLSAYWYPDATRYVGYNPPTQDKTISEFPAYSFVVSDLHAHLISILFTLTILGVVLSYIAKSKSILRDRHRFIIEALLGFLLGLLVMTNSWDYPIYLFIIGLAIFSVNLWRESWKEHLLRIAEILIISIIVALPFLVTFNPITRSLGLADQHTTLYQFLVLWGWPLLLSLLFFLFKIFESKFSPKDFFKQLGQKISSLSSSDLFVIISIFAGLILMFAPEIIYIKDIYSREYERANTMFKFTFAGFTIFTVISGYLISFLIGRKKWFGRIAAFLALFCLVAPLLFSTKSIAQNYSPLGLSNYHGLYGLSFLSEGDRGAVNWFQQNVSGSVNILEACGDSYTSYGRISMATGLPTVINWPNHEWLWRGSYDPAYARLVDVATIYQSSNDSVVQSLLKKYQVKYIVLGELEKEKYPSLSEEKVESFGTVVFDLAGTKIIKVRAN